MEEIFRFQQIRQSQTLPAEYESQLGLFLYPDQSLSDFAEDLVASSSEKQNYTATLARFSEAGHGKNVLKNESDIHPVIRNVYSWLRSKSRPVKAAQFRSFLNSQKSDPALNLFQEWTLYADNFALSIANQQITVNFYIDFDLLIKTCQLFKHLTTNQSKHLDGSEELSDELIHEVLSRPILLPRGILSSRCDDNCAKQHIPSLPTPAVDNGKHGDGPLTCKTDVSPKSPSQKCLCIKTYISDLFIVREELVRYEPGEIADIENILAGELKVRKHRTLLRSENSTESESETITNEERDHQVSEKFTLQSEVKNTVDSKTNVDAGVVATFKYGQAVTVTPHANVTINSAKSDSESTARSYAKDIVDRSVSKIQDKIRKVQVSKLLNEIEDRDKHSIDNSAAAAAHRAGLFYWVNKVSHAQVFNYGKHMMFDVIVPEPAAVFKQLFVAKSNQDKAKQKPAKPNFSVAGITNSTYAALLNEHSISSEQELQPPNPSTAVQFAFSFHVTDPDKNEKFGFSSSEFKCPPIPKGYRATHVRHSITASTGHALSTGDLDQVALRVHFGTAALLTESFSEFGTPTEPPPVPNKTWTSVGDTLMNNEEGALNLALSGYTTLPLSVSGTLSVTCEPNPETIEKWKIKIYNLIMADYNRKLDLYNATNNVATIFNIKGRNAFLNREIERNEFKRHIIALLMCNYFNAMGSMMDNVFPCGYAEINFAKLEADAPVVQFFEQILEWEYVTYLFYHSMWARKSKWAELIDEDSGDPLFDKFLMSGAARVQVPVRTGMEEIFSWFLKTGQIWGASGVPPVAGDVEYLSMIQELKEAKQCDYTDRPGLVQTTKGSSSVKIVNSNFYWDAVNGVEKSTSLENDLDREILLGFKTYRIVSIADAGAADHASWDIELDRPYEGKSTSSLKHSVGALHVGAPWEIVIPTKLVYLRNTTDILPEYPLT